MWFLFIVACLVLYQTVPSADQRKEITWGEFYRAIDDKAVKSVKVDGTDIMGTMHKGDAKFVVYGPIGEELQTKLAKMAATGNDDFVFQYKQQERDTLWQSLIISWLPMLVLFVIFFVFMRQLQSSGGKAMSFGKSKAAFE